MINPMELTGKRIMVTGASSGIGRETAILLSNLGAQVVLLGRDEQRLAETKDNLSGDGHVSISLELREFEKHADAFSGIVYRNRCSEWKGSISGWKLYTCS